MGTTHPTLTSTVHSAAAHVEDLASQTSQSIDKGIKTISNLIDLDEAPNWMRQGDRLIVRAYRRQQDSFRGCFASLFYLHNESVNIWSHLLGGGFFLYLAVAAAWVQASFSFSSIPGSSGSSFSSSLLLWPWRSLFPQDQAGGGAAGGGLSGEKGKAFAQADLVALQVYLVGATICCLFSAFYHCVSCHSETVARKCLKLDYLGIVFNITSTCISATYFGMCDDPFLRKLYITLIVACGLAAFWAVVDPGADGQSAAKYRAAVFIALGASGFAPIIHAALWPSLTLAGFSMEHVMAQSAFYLLGTAFYVNRIPESRWQGVFDVWGASHQIFHVLVNVAQIVHLLGLRKSLMLHHTY